jgi:hypothetical protein
VNYRSAWENHTRVPVAEPADDEDDAPRPERSAVVMLRRLVGVMLADPNPALGRECLALVTSIGYEGNSMQEIAKRHKVTRASVSKRCIDLCETLGIPPNRAMRSVKNRERCRVARFRETADT